MRYGFISTMEASPWGGSEDLWSDAAAHLLSRGDEVIACVKDWRPNEPAPLHRLAQQGLQLFRRSTDEAPVSTARLLRRKLSYRLGISRPPISPFVQFSAARPAFTLLSVGGFFPQNHHCHDLLKNDLPYAILFQSASEHWWPDDRSRNEAARLMESARAVLFVSNQNRELISRQLAFEHPRTLIVRNSFRVDYSQTIPWPKESPQWRIAVVGRLEPESKGCDLALEVLSHPEWRDRAVEVTFFGSGHAEQGVRALAARLRLPSVRFAGHVANVADIWRTHHFLLLPSRYEGLPLAVIEAMLCGRPCLATDVGGNRELITEGETGFLAASPTAASVAEALNRAWSMRNQWAKMGAAAAVAVRSIIPPSPAKELVDLLSRLVTKR